MARRSMLIDLTRCIGCDACTVACKQENGTPLDTFFARVINIEAGSFPNVKRMYLPVLCNHCEDPVCLKACPNKAIVKRSDGIVLVDQDRCRGTGACVSACPYGNIILSDRNQWYLNDDEPYERDFVRPRIKDGVAKKCTYCAHRVDDGLDPACVVACPTNARIFGDVEDPESRISKYIVEQKRLTGRDPFVLLPQARTKPSGMYLGTMADQQTGSLCEPPRHANGRAKPKALVGTALLLLALLVMARASFGQPKTTVYDATSCMACHGPAGSGGMGPRVSNSKLDYEQFLKVVREGKGSMPPTSPDELSDDAVKAVYTELRNQTEVKGPSDETTTGGPETYASSTCVGCHGQTGMGGLGPPLAKTKLKYEEFLKIIREGKGMMPGAAAKDLSDEDAKKIHSEVGQLPWREDQIPIAFKVGQVLTTKSVALIFLGVFLLATVFAIKVLAYWLRISGAGHLRPYIPKLGYLKAIGIVLKALIIDGLLVISLFKANKFRWIMHGLMLYGFVGLILADVLMQIYNPARGDLPLSSPLKLLPLFAGTSVMVGVFYVMYRYRSDEYIDNGVTMGRDLLFVNLLFHTLLSGFLTVMVNRMGESMWVMPVYVYHLAAVGLLIATAPFTRFSHAFIVPALVAVTRLTEAIVESGADLGFQREPSPGRHHKTLRIAHELIGRLAPESASNVRIRYYP